MTPAELLRRIHEVVHQHQEQFGATFRALVPELAASGLHLVDDAGVGDAQQAALRREFEERIAPELSPLVLGAGALPFLRNRAIYLVAELLSDQEETAPEYGIVEIPTARLPRFVSLPGEDGSAHVLFLDDVLRLHLGDLFPGKRVGRAHSIKVSRDAELYLEEELADSVVEAVRRSLGKRDTGLPTRFLYDARAPAAMLRRLKDAFGLADADLVAGGRYHNLHDLHSFPRPDRVDGGTERLPPLPHPTLQHEPSLLEAVLRRDRVLHFPYQSYDYLIRFLNEAAGDDAVEEIWITLYRVAPESAVVNALVDAARKGKRVTAFVEVQARFDEAANLALAERLAEAGGRTLYSLPGLKVHAKLIMIVRRIGEERKRICCLSTGNFNERTARIYADHALLTANQELAADVGSIFAFLSGEVPRPELRHLLAAPFTMRDGLLEMVAREREAALSGRPARVILKMNSLQDARMIAALYEASRAGVRVELVVRGICCLAAGIPGLSRNVSARSIVDRFLEHARVFVFHDGGRERCYLASADWMVRNLDHRVEARGPVRHRAQMDTYRWLRGLAAAEPAPTAPAAAERRGPVAVRTAASPDRGGDS